MVRGIMALTQFNKLRGEDAEASSPLYLAAISVRNEVDK